MARPKKKEPSETKRKHAPATTPEARENQLIALAIDLAEEQLLNGTASSQVITHYLKLGTTKERLEKEKLQQENRLLKAKTESLESNRRVEEIYTEALKAMRTYSGSPEKNDED